MSGSEEIHILLLGATGYIGGSVLSRLLSNGEAGIFKITVVVRDGEKARKLEPFGVTAVVSSLDDTDYLKMLASQADIIFECADADDLDSTQAILAGMKERHSSTNRVPSLIHTVYPEVPTITSDAYPTDTIYYDNDVNQMESLTPNQPHRVIDVAVVAADKEGYVKTYIVLPSTIYGLARGPLVDARIMNPQSQQIPALIIASLDRGRAGVVGEGRNIWPNVQIDDVVHLYEVILNAILDGREIGHGREGYYFGENGEHHLLNIAQAIGGALKAFGLSDTDEPSTFTKEELDKYFAGSESLGSNSRCRAARSNSIGWNAEKTTKDMLESIKPEIEYVLSRRL